MSTPNQPPDPKHPINLRNPSTFTPTSPESIHTNGTFIPPSTEWLTGTWHVTHSTLPMWRKARNISITYTPLTNSSSSSQSTEAQSQEEAPKLNDQVKYQSLNSNTDKLKTICGISSPVGPGAFNWRGSGWLKIASSHWEILGYGGGGVDAVEGDQWAVTFFAKTLFTPPGIDVYSRRREGLSEQKMRDIGEALSRVEDPAVKALAGKLFEVKRDI